MPANEDSHFSMCVFDEVMQEVAPTSQSENQGYMAPHYKCESSSYRGNQQHWKKVGSAHFCSEKMSTLINYMQRVSARENSRGQWM